MEKLVERGGAWTSPLGSPHSVNLERGTVEPFTLASALEDASRRPGLLAMTQA